MRISLNHLTTIHCRQFVQGVRKKFLAWIVEVSIAEERNCRSINNNCTQILWASILTINYELSVSKHEIQLQLCKYSWIGLWIVQCFTSPPTQYRLYRRRFLQVKRPNQQYQSTEGKSTKENNPESKKTQNTHAYTQNGKTNTAYNYNTASPLVYNNMGWLGDSSHRGQGCQAWTAVPPKRRRSLEVFSLIKTPNCCKTENSNYCSEAMQCLCNCLMVYVWQNSF